MRTASLNFPTGTVISVLMVEDDPHKASRIESEIREHLGRVRFHYALSVREAVQKVEARSYDCIILDIALPSRTRKLGGGAPMSMSSGGLEVLYELADLERSDPVIIITQYPDIDVEGSLVKISSAKKRLREYVSANIISVIYFETSSSLWKQNLRDAL
tara:strand:+ start:1827 stop:2303 length:477 start_codon:yes stop_codon:yes gene_type:complete